MVHKACAAPLAALLLIAAAPAVPATALASSEEQSSASASSGQSALPAKAERKICKRFADTTSRMRSTRLCLTRAEWREFEETQE